MIHKINTILTFNKLAYVRICIIELSRIPLHEFYYGYIKIKYGNKLRLLFKDTGSLVYEIKTKNFYENFSKNKDVFAFGNYSSKPKH